MASISIAPQVLATSGLFVCDDVQMSVGAWIPTGVVTADLRATYKGTGLPFAGRFANAVAPRPRQSASTGITSTSPPV
jgi:hypothetical protein